MFIGIKLLNFKVWKSSQISCAHKPYFLMQSHIWPSSIIKFIPWSNLLARMYCLKNIITMLNNNHKAYWFLYREAEQCRECMGRFLFAGRITVHISYNTVTGTLALPNVSTLTLRHSAYISDCVLLHVHIYC